MIQYVADCFRGVQVPVRRNQEGGALCPLALECRVKEVFDLLQAFRSHLLIASCMKALAKVHSFITVPGGNL